MSNSHSVSAGLQPARGLLAIDAVEHTAARRRRGIARKGHRQFGPSGRHGVLDIQIERMTQRRFVPFLAIPRTVMAGDHDGDGGIVAT
ncbi:MAG: hypothetical protein ABI165_15845 [Bryobacteraceae bacterium]